jgi:hypothetical protein
MKSFLDSTIDLNRMHGAVRTGDLLAALIGGRIKPHISHQEFVTIAFEVTLDTKKARDRLGYHPVVTVDDGMSELKARYLETFMKSGYDIDRFSLFVDEGWPSGRRQQSEAGTQIHARAGLPECAAIAAHPPFTSSYSGSAESRA